MRIINENRNCPPNAPLHKEKRDVCVAVIQQQQAYPNKFIDQHKDTGSDPLQPNVIVHWRIDLLGPTQEVQFHLNLGRGLNRSILREALFRWTLAAFNAWPASNVASIPAIISRGSNPTSQAIMYTTVKFLLAQSESST
jgi:hypothetical protein